VADPTMDPLAWRRKQLDDGDPDLVRALVRTFAEQLISADVDALAGAPYGSRSTHRTNCRNGYPGQRWDTRAGTIDLQIPARPSKARRILE
jgi:transposase-like protein